MIAPQLNVTKTVYRVGDFVAWQRNEQLELRPEFQRGNVWSKKAKSYFLDSLIKGFPVPIVFLQNQTDPDSLIAKRRVVDGQQRLRTLLAFVAPDSLKDRTADDDFVMLRTHDAALGGKRFPDLPGPAKQQLLQAELSVHVLPETTPNALLLEIFARLNSSGLKLTKQELRNAQFHGDFKQACYDLAFEYTDQWLAWDILSRPAVARMQEVELVSELLLLMERGIDRKAQTALNKAYAAYDDRYPLRHETEKRLRSMMAVLATAYESTPPPKAFQNQGWFYALFAAGYFKAYPRGLASSKRKRIHLSPDKLLAKSKQLQEGRVPAPLLKALRGAATDKSSRLERVRFVEGTFEP